jgi:DNA replication protein DnaC
MYPADWTRIVLWNWPPVATSRVEDRHGMKSTIIVSQLPVANWYDMMKVNSTAADAILDRIVHMVQRFELEGDRLRKK